MTNAKVELFDVALKGCASDGLRISDCTSETTLVATRCDFANSGFGAVVDGSLTSATFNNCVFNDNEYDGISGASGSAIHLHGEATAIHSNVNDGIAAHESSEVIIHLPSNHNTIYNNGREDRRTDGAHDISYSPGTITNIED